MVLRQAVDGECDLNGSDPRQAEPYPLFSEDLLHLADFLLDLPTYLFDLTFGFYYSNKRVRLVDGESYTASPTTGSSLTVPSSWGHGMHSCPWPHQFVYEATA